MTDEQRRAQWERSRRAARRRVDRKPVREGWVTVSTRGSDVRFCLWATRDDARDGCDPDEIVVRVEMRVVGHDD